jgi:hypothetical protein
VGSHEEDTSRSNYESKSAIFPPPKAPVTNTSTTEDIETQCSSAAKDSLEDSEGSGNSSATITQESGKKKGTAYPSKLPSPERFIVPPSFSRKEQKKNASVSLHYPQYFSSLLAYSETTAENVIRPCIVTNLIEAPFLQWFGFLRCPNDGFLRVQNDGFLRVFAYDRISGPIHILPKSFKLPRGIPFSKNIIDDVQHSVRKDIFTNEDPARFATYHLHHCTTISNSFTTFASSVLSNSGSALPNGFGGGPIGSTPFPRLRYSVSSVITGSRKPAISEWLSSSLTCP